MNLETQVPRVEVMEMTTIIFSRKILDIPRKYCDVVER